MTSILQTQDAEALSALRAAGVLVSDSHDDKGGLAYLFPGHGTHFSSMFETHLARSAAAAELIAMADENGQMIVPTRMRGARLYRQPQVRERCYGRIIVLEDYDDGPEVRLEIVDEAGMLLCSGDHIRLTAIGTLSPASDLLLSSVSSSGPRM